MEDLTAVAVEGKDSRQFGELFLEFRPEIVDEGEHQASIAWPGTPFKHPPEQCRLPGDRASDDDLSGGTGGNDLCEDAAELRLEFGDHVGCTLGSELRFGQVPRSWSPWTAGRRAVPHARV